ncbi:helix-turn-helix domain-containing protein [Neobacillus sp. SM06]|uniref:helix-turn-helix domain-containing protein n=1 Tax=Neobacillus sp. SM06 TaxID=3422492 RepID=UPI003D2B84C3
MNEPLSHRQLQSLIQVSNVLNSSLDIDTIMNAIMVQTVSVIDAADGGALFIFDRENGFLTAKADSRFKSDILKSIKLRPGESMTGMAFSARQCLIFPNREEVEKANETLSETNRKLMVDSIPTIPYSTICAPIFLKEECIGVIVLDSFDPSLHFINEDINLLKAIAHQAAVALEKASLYLEQEKTVKQLKLLNDTISKQNEWLSRSVEIHNSLATLVLNGEGLDSIIRYLRKKIGRPIILVDDLGELIFYTDQSMLSSEILSAIKTKAVESMGIVKLPRQVFELSFDQKPLKITILPIGTKPNLFGSLVIAESIEMNDVDITALEHACTVISLEMMKEQAVFEAEERMNGELIEALSAGKIDSKLLQRGKQLQFEQEALYMAMILQLDEQEQSQKQTSMVRHLVNMANRVFLKNFAKGLAVRHHDQVIILLSFQQKVSTTYVNLQIKELIGRFQHEIALKNWGTTVSFGIGRIHSGLAKVTKSLQEASKCLQFIRSYNQSKAVIHYQELGVQRLLLQNSEEELIDFIFEILGPAIEYDQNRKGELLTTLFTYLHHNQNSKAAAESIPIHFNTLTYRLKKIEQLLGIDLADNQQFLNVQLAANLFPFFKDKLPVL